MLYSAKTKIWRRRWILTVCKPSDTLKPLFSIVGFSAHSRSGWECGETTGPQWAISVMSVVGLCDPTERKGERALHLRWEGNKLHFVCVCMNEGEHVNTRVNLNKRIIYLYKLSTPPTLSTHTYILTSELSWLDGLLPVGTFLVDIKYFSQPQDLTTRS